MGILDKVKIEVSGITRAFLSKKLALSDAIEAELKETGMSQKDLAASAGMEESTLSRLIRADVNPTFKTVIRLEQALGIELFSVVARTKQSVQTVPLEEISSSMVSVESQAERTISAPGSTNGQILPDAKVWERAGEITRIRSFA